MRVRQQLEQHCNSTFALTRAFKIFDKDMSNSIDKEEMRAVLITFSIDLSGQILCSYLRTHTKHARAHTHTHTHTRTHTRAHAHSHTLTHAHKLEILLSVCVRALYCTAIDGNRRRLTCIRTRTRTRGHTYAHTAEKELDDLMSDFGAIDCGDGNGRTIKYQVAIYTCVQALRWRCAQARRYHQHFWFCVFSSPVKSSS